MTILRSRAAIAVMALSTVLVTACSATGSDEDAGSVASSRADATEKARIPEKIRVPDANTAFDYQLGGAYPPPVGVRAVSRDRAARPAAGMYNICYVNAFQTQPGDAVDWWKKRHPDLLLKNDDGDLVVDEDWKEPLLDISTPARRDALMKIVGPWIDGCADAGFDAVEPDNLDSYERSDGKLTPEHAEAFARLLAARAHRRHLAVAQKNTADLLPRRTRIGFDFAVVEECARYKECPDYSEAYGGRVFDIEYVKKDFTAACRSWGGKLSITLRDHDVRPAGSRGYVRASC
ncbi:MULTISPECIES: endo alpha-1,4 polygalactosaminidase [Streptomyces]|uniref:endo alpha-1,4 polygalactosaminidase n=1 Tax=Streptomyces TaxID=1883 RepID=UPI001CCBBC9F|nr:MULTISPECIES: endo alpha-1,4 polygalactosaminidase [Streptomyces]UBI35104.1 endo alpha-1,4 polygalactosaminidase [Streptomyces mobaraensis]UKW27698.1 endo alpha-1,4 polygalactosaminidase [Streptomyces sp. TYQ1024]